MMAPAWDEGYWISIVACGDAKLAPAAADRGYGVCIGARRIVSKIIIFR